MSITSPRACPLPLRTPRSCKCDFLHTPHTPHPSHPAATHTTLTPTIVFLLLLPLLPPPSVFLLLRRLRRPLFLGLPRPTVRACIRPVPLSPVHTGLLAGRRGGAERAAAREAPQTLRGGKRADRPFRQAARAEVRVRIAQRAPRHALAHARGADPAIFTTPHISDAPSAPPVAHVAHHPASTVQPHTTPHTPSGADARVAARGPHRARLAAQPLGLRGDALRLRRLRLHLPRPRRRRQLTSRRQPLQLASASCTPCPMRVSATRSARIPLSYKAVHTRNCAQAFMNSWLISIAQRFLAMEPIIILVSK